jgi:hypothetical protein
VYEIQHLLSLEKHLIVLNQFKVHPCTALDFCLHLTLIYRNLWTTNEPALNPLDLANQCVHVLHFSMAVYDVSCRRYSSIAVAAICFV